jgi:hypothetical protein
MKNFSRQLASSFSLPLIFLWLAFAGPVRADTLTFIPSGSPLNYSWFSAGNWYTNNLVNNSFGAANRIPVPTDTAVIYANQTVNAAGNTINLVALVLDYNAGVNGGNFIVSTLQMDDGINGGTTTFNNSIIDVLSAMYVVGGNNALNSCVLTIDKGATCFVGSGGTGQLTFSSSVIYNVGQIALYPNGSFLEGGTNLFIFSGATISGSSNVTLSVSGGNLDNSGTVRSDGGTFNVSAFTWSSTNQLGKFKTSVTNAVLLFSSGMTIPTNVTYVFSGPGTSQFPNGATVQGTAQVGIYDTNLLAWDNGTLQDNGTLAGTGMIHVAAAPGFPSELDLNAYAILNDPTVNIDAGGTLDFISTSSSGVQITGGVVNNSGIATWLGSGSGLYLASPAIFNNLADALFDCQITNHPVDGNITGNGVVNNAGTFRKSKGTNDIMFGSTGPAFNNSGLLDVESGQLELSSGTNSGTFNMSPGTEIWFGGNTYFFVAGAQVNGTNFVRVFQNGVLVLDTNLTLANFQLNTGGTLDGPANLTITSNFNWPAGTLQGGGAVNISAGAAFNLNTGYSGNGYATNRIINNAGTAIMTNGYASANVGVVFNNLAGGLLEIDKNGGFGFPNPSPNPRPVLNNFGTFRDSSPGSSPMDFNITNQGLVQIPTNQLNCYQYHQLAGTTVLGSNAVLNVADGTTSPLTLQGGTLSAAGTIQANVVNSGGTINLGSSPAFLYISGSTGIYTQTVAGALSIKIGGTTSGSQYDQLNASSGTLGGTLNISFINGFNPALGDKYRVVASSYGGIYNGAFNTLNGVHATNGLVLVPVYGYYAGYYFLTLVAANDPVLSMPFHSGNQFVFSFPTTSGLTNVLEYTDSLNPANWQPFATNIGDGSVHSVTNSTTSTNRFYRVRFQ